MTARDIPPLTPNQESDCLKPAMRRARPLPADTVESPVTLADDEEIYCPACTYNLTGCHAGRCPECGAYFDRPTLIAAQRAHTIALMPWDSPESMPASRRLLDTLSICLFRPTRFSHAVSTQSNLSGSSSFLMLIAAVATAGSVAGLLVNIHRGWVFRNIGLAIVSMAAFMLTLVFVSTLLNATLLWITCPHYDKRRRFRPWHIICRYAACHYIIAVAVAPVLLIPIRGHENSAFNGMVILVCLAIGCTMLNALTLAAVVRARTAFHVRSPTLMKWLLMGVGGWSLIMAGMAVGVMQSI
jgi:hypothetical protein